MQRMAYGKACHESMPGFRARRALWSPFREFRAFRCISLFPCVIPFVRFTILDFLELHGFFCVLLEHGELNEADVAVYGVSAMSCTMVASSGVH